MKKSNIIGALKERLEKLEDWRAKGEKTRKKQKEDEDVCPVCGGDLLYVEEGIVECPKCKQFFEIEEEEVK